MRLFYVELIFHRMYINSSVLSMGNSGVQHFRVENIIYTEIANWLRERVDYRSGTQRLDDAIQIRLTRPVALSNMET